MIFFETEDLTLEFEKVFFECGYPVLFTARDSNKNLFLCVCCQADENGKKWLVRETKTSIVIKMLQDRITLRDAFICGNGKKYSISEKKGHFTVACDVETDWNDKTSMFLPDAGEFLDAEDGEFDEEISFYNDKVDYAVEQKSLLKCELPSVYNEYLKADYRKVIDHETIASDDFSPSCDDNAFIAA